MSSGWRKSKTRGLPHLLYVLCPAVWKEQWHSGSGRAFGAQLRAPNEPREPLQQPRSVRGGTGRALPKEPNEPRFSFRLLPRDKSRGPDQASEPRGAQRGLREPPTLGPLDSQSHAPQSLIAQPKSRWKSTQCTTPHSSTHPSIPHTPGITPHLDGYISLRPGKPACSPKCTTHPQS